MPTSVNLSNVPYTGFDLGPIYNSLFWVALLIWSFIIARAIIKLSGRKVVKVSVKRQERKEQALAEQIAKGPQVLEERVIRYQDPGIPAVATYKEFNNVIDIQPPEPPKEVVEKVQDIVERELLVTRAGESPDEFSEEDFETMDFDGVNPDVYWMPKPERSELPIPAPAQVPNEFAAEITVSKVVEPKQEPQEASIKIEHLEDKKKYKDTLELDKRGEYPKLLLTREEVSV